MGSKGSKKNIPQVQAMPKYFRQAHLKMHEVYNEAASKERLQASRSKFYVAMAGLLVVLIILGGGYGYQAYFSGKQEAELRAAQLKQEEEAAKQAEIERKLAEEQAQREKEAADRDAQVSEAQKRDMQRLQDVLDIQISLEYYFDDQRSYPKELPFGGSLKAGDVTYLELVPEEKESTVSAYRYEVRQDGLGYTLAFTAEEGVKDVLPGIVEVSHIQQVTSDGRLVQRPEKDLASLGSAVLTSFDSDQDGLTNVEEDLYGTNKFEFDSDNDTYSDKQEILNLYNPSGNAPVTLLESGKVQVFEGGAYTIFYHNNWKVNELGATVELISLAEEKVTVATKQLDADETLADYVQNIFSNTELEEVTTNKGELKGYKSPDRFTAYFEKGGVVYILTHEVGNKDRLDFMATFEMMIKSFTIL